MKVFKSYEWVYVNKYFDEWRKGGGVRGISVKI